MKIKTHRSRKTTTAFFYWNWKREKLVAGKNVGMFPLWVCLNTLTHNSSSWDIGPAVWLWGNHTSDGTVLRLSSIGDEDLKGEPQENCLAHCTEGLILAVEICLYVRTCVEIGYMSPQECLGCSVFLSRERSWTFSWKHRSLPRHYAFPTSATSCRGRSTRDLPALGSCGCDGPSAVVVAGRRGDFGAGRIRSTVAISERSCRISVLLALPSLIPTRCRVTKWDPSKDSRLQTQVAVGTFKLSPHLTSSFKSIRIIT